jgi:hypothetical protein
MAELPLEEHISAAKRWMHLPMLLWLHMQDTKFPVEALSLHFLRSQLLVPASFVLVLLHKEGLHPNDDLILNILLTMSTVVQQTKDHHLIQIRRYRPPGFYTAEVAKPVSMQRFHRPTEMDLH